MSGWAASTAIFCRQCATMAGARSVNSKRRRGRVRPRMRSKIPCHNRFRAQGLPLDFRALGSTFSQSSSPSALLFGVAVVRRGTAGEILHDACFETRFRHTGCISRQARSARSQHAWACVRGSAWPASATMASALLGSSSRNSSARSTGTTRSRLPCKMSTCAAGRYRGEFQHALLQQLQIAAQAVGINNPGPAVVRRRATTGVKIGQQGRWARAPSARASALLSARAPGLTVARRVKAVKAADNHDQLRRRP